MTPSGDEFTAEPADDGQPAENSPPESPYRALRREEHQRSETDSSVFAEPRMQATLHPSDTSDPGPAVPLSDHVSEDQSVWDEPGLSTELAGEAPSDALTWYRWYQSQIAATSESASWMATLGVVLVSGVFAIFGTIAAQSTYGGMLLGVIVVGPTTEEIMKIALPLWLVEKRPWLYRNPGQILICALASGTGFAAVENVIYLNVYVPNPSASLAAWRWTVCVLLHAGCSTIAGIGVIKIWQRFQQQQRAPNLADGAHWLVWAIIVHGLYNGTVTALELSGLEF